MTDDRLIRLTLNPDLAFMSVRWAAQLHRERYLHNPVTLICATGDVQTAYEILRQSDTLQGMIVVPVPGAPRGWWAVCSPSGMVGSCP